VPDSRILVESKSLNTHEEALIVATMLSAIRHDHVVLVTSALHMRRSMGAFRAAGIDVIPAVARSSRAANHWTEWILPSQAGLEEGALLAHELAGQAYYVVRGWYR